MLQHDRAFAEYTSVAVDSNQSAGNTNQAAAPNSSGAQKYDNFKRARQSGSLTQISVSRRSISQLNVKSRDFSNLFNSNTQVYRRRNAHLSDEKILASLLNFIFEEKEANEISKRIIGCFGDFGSVVLAREATLLRIKGVNREVIELMKCVYNATTSLAAMPIKNKSILRGWDDLCAYLYVTHGWQKSEKFNALFLDTKNRLIADEEISSGTVNHTMVYPREVVRRALELEATAMIIVHNHPSGDTRPSPHDLQTTDLIRCALTVMGIVLHDHIIVGPGEIFSFKRHGYL